MLTRVVPNHVPAELVFDFDYISATHDKIDPHGALMELDAKGVRQAQFSR